MKIDPSNAANVRLDPLSRAKGSDSAAGAAKPGVRGAPTAAPDTAATPAASVEINAAARESLRGLDGAADQALLDELRNKVASGQFEIKFDEVAQAILMNAITASKSRITSS